MSVILRSLSVLALAGLASAPAFAFDFVVTRYDDPEPNGCLAIDCSLREAVIAANAGSDSDRILLSAGTYELTIAGAPESFAASGDLDIRETLEIVGPGAPMTTVDGNFLVDPVFSVLSVAPGPVIFRGLAIRGGNSGSGSGITITSSVVEIEECEIHSNGQDANEGGVATSNASTVTIRRSTIRDNQGPGVMLQAASGLIENTTFSNNASTELEVRAGGFTDCVHCTIVDDALGNEEVLVVNDTGLRFELSLLFGTCSTSDGGEILTQDGNAESPGDTCGWTDTNDQTDIANHFLEPLGNHGGPTSTIPPSPLISAAVDVGSITTCSPTDQRGVTRPVAGDSFPGVQCDAGAVEVTADPVAAPIFRDGFLQGHPGAWSDAVGD